jgi:hypothetical protein
VTMDELTAGRFVALEALVLSAVEIALTAKVGTLQAAAALFRWRWPTGRRSSPISQMWRMGSSLRRPLRRRARRATAKASPRQRRKAGIAAIGTDKLMTRRCIRSFVALCVGLFAATTRVGFDCRSIGISCRNIKSLCCLLLAPAMSC